MIPILLRIPSKIESGFKTISQTVYTELPHYGFDPFILPNCQTDEFISNRKITKEMMEFPELCICPIQIDKYSNNDLFKLPDINHRIFLTMWETTKISLNVVESLNKCKLVIVPNEYNKQNFIKDGVTTPIIKIPLFVDTNIYNYKTPTQKNIFTFGTGNADYRKRINDVITCFCKAFKPSIKDVELQIKIRSSELSKIRRTSDERIKINTKKLSKLQLAEWYHTNDIFLSGVTAEGWGLMQHESMACGRTVIAPIYAGLNEFMNKTNSIDLKYEEELATGNWSESNGFWSSFNEDDMIDKMRWVYNNPLLIKDLGLVSSQTVKKYSIENFMKEISKILVHF